MRRAFISNFDFEHQLAGVTRKGTVQLARDLSATWLAIAKPGDVIEGLLDVDDEFEAELARLGRTLDGVGTTAEQVGRSDSETDSDTSLEPTPWGWSSEIHEDRSPRATRPIPDPRFVAKVNSRRYSHDLARILKCRLPSASLVQTPREFRYSARDLAEHERGWIAKAEFSMSSRERILSREAPTDEHSKWVENRISENGAVFVEPLLDIVEEAAAQFEISKDGNIERLGMTGLLTTDQGRFAGIWLRRASEYEDQFVAAEQVAFAAAEKVADAGYFGPLGIDMACYMHREQLRVRPLQDINARFTMGRLALGYSDVLMPDEQAMWLFVPWTQVGCARKFMSDVRDVLANDVRAYRTSPWCVNGEDVRLGTVLLAGSHAASLTSTAAAIQELCDRRLRIV